MNTFNTQAGGLVQYAPRTLPSKNVLFGAHFSHDGIGGFVEVPNISYRNGIPIAEEMNSDGMSSGRRKLGMLVYTAEENRYFQLVPLSSDPTGTVRMHITYSDWVTASDAQKMVWLDPTKTREDIFNLNSTGDLIVGTNNPDDAWKELYVEGWQSTYTTVSAHSASEWDNSLVKAYADGNFLPLSGGVVDGNVSIHGNFFVTGTSALISAVNLVVDDALIYLGDDNLSNGLDIGFIGSFTESPIGYQHTGLVRLHDVNEWSLFSGLTTEPLESTVISRTDQTFTVDTLRANIKGNLLTSTDVFGYLSSTGILYASGGNSDIWNTTSTTVSTNSAKWETAYNTVSSTILQKGNTFGESVVIGSNDAFSLVLETSGTPRVTILSSGNVGIGNSTPNHALTVSGDVSANALRLTSATSSASGIQFGTDVNLYRRAANVLKTDDAFECAAASNTTSNTVLVQGSNNAINARSISPSLWTVGDTVSSLSANWNSVFSSVSTTSATWNQTSTDLKNLSGDWQSTFTTVSSNSANWETAYSTVSSAILHKGNTFGESVIIGSNDAFSLVLETSGTPRVTILSSGNVGIGNSTPNHALTVSGDVSANALRLTSATSPLSGIQFGTDVNLYRLSNTILATDDNFRPNLASNTVSNEVVVARTTATANTLEKRSINSQTWNTTAVFLTSDSAFTLAQNYIPKAQSNNSLRNSQIYDDGTNIGIGTTSPTKKLTVSGSLSASDYLHKRIELKPISIPYTFSLGDQNALLLFDYENETTVLIPNDASVSFPSGAEINFVMHGTGVVRLSADDGVTLRSADGRDKLRVQNSTATVVKLSSNDWLLFGDIWKDDLE